MKETRGESNVLIWVVVIVVILLVLFFMFRGGKEAGDKKEQGKVAGPNGKLPVLDEIDGLEVELSDNPDIGVDDFNSLPVSQEEIVG